MAEPAKATEEEAVALPQPTVDQIIDALLLEHRGNARAAMAELLAHNAEIERELDETRMVVSAGYTRGWHRNRIGQHTAKT